MITSDQLAQVEARVTAMLRLCFWPWINGNVLHFSGPAAAAIIIAIAAEDEDGHHDCLRQNDDALKVIWLELGSMLRPEDQTLFDALESVGADQTDTDFCAEDHVWAWTIGLCGDENQWLGDLVIHFVRNILQEFKITPLPASAS